VIIADSARGPMPRSRPVAAHRSGSSAFCGSADAAGAVRLQRCGPGIGSRSRELRPPAGYGWGWFDVVAVRLVITVDHQVTHGQSCMTGWEFALFGCDTSSIYIVVVGSSVCR
jgi:hypothetical protein